MWLSDLRSKCIHPALDLFTKLRHHAIPCLDMPILGLRNEGLGEDKRTQASPFVHYGALAVLRCREHGAAYTIPHCSPEELVHQGLKTAGSVLGTTGFLPPTTYVMHTQTFAVLLKTLQNRL